MRFLKLLDPFEFKENDLHGVGQQQARAREKFPDLVEESPFRYWRPNYQIANSSMRMLIGVSAGFSLPNLRLLDLIAERGPNTLPRELCIDVFDLDDVDRWEAVAGYFPGINTMVPPPIVGIWRHGQHEQNLSGYDAVKWLIEYFKLETTPQILFDSVHPPDREMLEE